MIRPAQPDDAAQIAEVYNHGIADRIATFETEPRQTEDLKGWFSDKYPFLVFVQAGVVLGFVRASSYRERQCYAGIAEYSVYVSRTARGQGVGDALMVAFLPALRQAGFWKVLSRIFPENTASLALCQKHGFKQVGVYEKHAQLDGVWRDVVIVEKVLLPQ
jgi:L-amino acid N-acyltransferase YncA